MITADSLLRYHFLFVHTPYLPLFDDSSDEALTFLFGSRLVPSKVAMTCFTASPWRREL